MKAIFKNNLRIISILITLFYATQSYAQIGEWLADQIREDIQSRISSVTNYNSNTLGSFGNLLWESVVSAKCESDLENKAKELGDVEIDRSYLKNLPYKYPNFNRYWVQYSEIQPLLNERANSYFHQKNNLKFTDIANSKIDKFAEIYIDSLSSVSRIDAIEAVLTPTTLDSLNLFSNTVGLRDTLMKDINEEPSIAIILNNHPEAVRVYYNSLDVQSLRKRPQHLYYWAVTADSHKDKLPKKQRLINPRNLIFVSKNQSVDILDGENNLAQIKDSVLNVIDINIMNLNGRPNTTYVFGNNEWKTDANGRVLSAKQVCAKALKGKCKQTNWVNVKKYFAMGDDKGTYELGYYNSPDFGAPEVLLNALRYEKTKINKTAFKDSKKALNKAIKAYGETKVSASANYISPASIPGEIKIEDFIILNSGINNINKAPTVPDKKRFVATGDNAQPVYKIDIVKSSNSKNSNIASTKKSSTSSQSKKPTQTTSHVNTTQNLSSFNGTYTLKGKINGKYAVTMQLTFTDGDVSGTYYYDKYHRIMNIKGDITSNGTLKLFEFENTKETGKYEGFFNGEMFQGEFVNFANKKEMSFYLTVQ